MAQRDRSNVTRREFIATSAAATATLCHKMDGFLTDVVYNSERMLYPMKRVA